ncbi:MAG: hypothetical protein ACLUJI_09820 [Faecalibacillus faecis]|uniref:hypothetical protein n=1 Tax=Faecalibacillus faecis TaxID=1982628 RepID=UPI0039943493
MNQNDLIDAIKHYIKTPKCYYSAVLINAPWGAGKTYFVKNVLYTEVKKELQNANKYMIYISLNGINSVDLLCSRFNLAKLKLSNKPKNKNNIAYDSLNVISAFSDLLSEENQKKINAALKITGSMVKISKKLVMSFKGEEIIFILDDLERSTIPIEELLGCISDIAEQEGCKFILIGNEEKIKDQDKYHEIKEKVIGHTYLFKQDVQSVINGELKDKELKDYEGKIIDLLNNEESINYRVLFQSLETYKELKEMIKKIQFDYFKNSSNWGRFLYELLSDCYFNKKENIASKKEEKDNIEDSYKNLLFSMKNEDMHKFKFVNDVNRNGLYNVSLIKGEVERYIIKSIESEKTENLSFLRNNYFLMEDEEIIKHFNMIIDELESNEIDYILYPQIISFYYRLVSIDLYEENNMFDIMKRNICLNKYEYHTIELDSFNDFVPKNYTSNYKKIVKELITVQEDVQIGKEIDLSDDEDWVSKLESIYYSKEKIYMHRRAFFKYVNSTSLLEKINNSNNKTIDDFRGFIKKISRNFGFDHDQEIVRSLVEEIRKYLKEPSGSKIKKYQLDWLVSNLNEFAGIDEGDNQNNMG